MLPVQLRAPPWFCKELPPPTTDYIGVRAYSGTGAEDTAFQLIELYVQ